LAAGDRVDHLRRTGFARLAVREPDDRVHRGFHGVELRRHRRVESDRGRSLYGRRQVHAGLHLEHLSRDGARSEPAADARDSGRRAALHLSGSLQRDLRQSHRLREHPVHVRQRLDGLRQLFEQLQVRRIQSALQRAPENFVPLPFAEETVESIELGFKADITDTFRLNGAIFSSDYDDIQLIYRQGVVPLLFNAGRATIDGAELEFQFVPNDRLILEGGLSYRDDEIKDITEVPGATATITPDNTL